VRAVCWNGVTVTYSAPVPAPAAAAVLASALALGLLPPLVGELLGDRFDIARCGK
jgi:hypothetical protein